jgi:hypothetical protein
MASSPFARLLAPDHTDAGNVVVIARRPARLPAGATTCLRRVPTLDRELTTPANTCAAPLSARKPARLQRLRWSLSGLEPAAAGYRSASSGAAPPVPMPMPMPSMRAGLPAPWRPDAARRLCKRASPTRPDCLHRPQALSTRFAGFSLRWRDPDSNRGHHDFQGVAGPPRNSEKDRQSERLRAGRLGR